MNNWHPFNPDAALASEYDIARLPVQGGAAVRAFCGIDDSSMDWDERGICVLKARRGFGKSHVLLKRSLNHRDSPAASHTVFYPSGGKPRVLGDALSNMHVVVPRWLQGREAITAWLFIWQLSILGLLVWITGARSDKLSGYSEWFGKLERLDQAQAEGGKPGGQHAEPTLSMFIIRVLARMPDDYAAGLVQIKDGLFHGNSEWAHAVASSMARQGMRRAALYLDAPDELVELDPPSLWRNVQQGLLLAIWKFSKSSQLINIYATVRSEAFGSGDDHPDVSLAMGLVLPLRYSPEDLKAMLDDRIREADPSKLALPLVDAKGQRPIHALCGFQQVVHGDRKALDGGQYTEEVSDAILRHTRLVPREVIAIARLIYDMVDVRTPDSVRDKANTKASENIKDAQNHSFLGWNDAVHGRFAAKLSNEVVDAMAMEHMILEFGQEGPKIIKFFVQHGLLGIAEPQPQRHRHFYRQRFAFDEADGNEDASSINKDFFFVHTALKQWILSLPGQLNKRFHRMEIGVVGDRLVYEAKPPLMRLGIVRKKVTLKLENSRMTLDKGAKSGPLQFLFVVLCACRLLKESRVNLSELKDTWAKLRGFEVVKSALDIQLGQQPHVLAGKMHEWAKRINQDNEIRNLQLELVRAAGVDISRLPKDRKGRPLPDPFITVSERSAAGAQVVVSIRNLPIGELDWDETMYTLMGGGAK